MAAAQVNVRRHLPALLLFAVLTGVMVFPTVEVMTRGGVPGWEGDNVYYVHSMWWWKHSLFELHTSPFVDTESFYPVGRANGRSELTVTNTIPAIPITWLFSPAVAYDVMVLLSFIATGFFTHLWVHQLTGRRDAGVLAGVITAFTPMRFAHLAGHLPQLTTQWIPLALYAFERFVEQRSLRRAVLFGAGVALTVLGCWYYGYALAIVLPVYVIARTWRSPVWRDRGWWVGLAASGAIAFLITSPFLYQMFKLRAAGQLARSLGEMDSWSLNVYDLFIPNLTHPVFGEWASRLFQHERALWVEHGVTLGYAALGLAIAGWFTFRRKHAGLGALLATWAVSFLIALGPTVHWGDHQVRVPVPLDIARLAAKQLTGAANGGDTRAMRESFANVGIPIPLPSLLMYRAVPLTSGMRVMARFAIYTTFMTAALAGFGLIALTGWAERRWGPPARGAVPVLAVALVLFESLSVQAVMPLGPRVVDAWLATQPGSMVIVELPVDQAQRSLQNYWMTVNRRKNFFGWVGDSFPPPVQIERAAALEAFPAPETLEYLRRSSATHLLITPSQVPTWSTIEPVLRGSPALADEQTLGDVRVYRIVHQER
jgi:hypothetical protein